MPDTKQKHQKIKRLEKIIKKQDKIISSIAATNVFSVLLDAIAGIHWSKDKNGKYLSCNEFMVKTLGLNNKSDIIGKTDYELPWAAQAHTLIKNDNEVMKEDKIQQNKEELVQTPALLRSALWCLGEFVMMWGMQAVVA